MATATQPTSSGSSILGASRSAGGAQSLPVLNAAQFREIHKNTWLKRLTAEGKKITVGPKKSERSWVVFCVHDDTEALLEGYAEPRQAASHNPEWVVSMQQTLHISHALIPNSNEFEFVVTLSNEVVRFHAISWEIMQEWVETLRSKLREMKILSPRENLYTKLPEARLPLLPTRDPTSPLPAPPPVPAAIVPGVEIVVPQSVLQTQQQPIPSTTTTSTTASTSSSLEAVNRNSNVFTDTTPITATTSSTTEVSSFAASTSTAQTNVPSHAPAMSNTLTQNLLNMLSDPISAYSEQLNATDSDEFSGSVIDEEIATSLHGLQLGNTNNIEDDDCLSPLLRPSCRPLTSPSDASNGVRMNVNHGNLKRHSADHARNVDNLNGSDRLIPRPHTSRSQSVGAADKTKHSHQLDATIANTNKNVTAFEVSGSKSPIVKATTSTATLATNENENTKTNITIIQVSTDSDSVNADTEESMPSLPLKNNIASSTPDVFKFPETHEDIAFCAMNSTPKEYTKLKQPEYKSNVQLIPSNSSTNSKTIKVLGDANSSSNQYSTPIRNIQQAQPTSGSGIQNDVNQITTVHVGGSTPTTSVSVYGTCYTPPPGAPSPMSTPKLPKKIILSANTSGITNITVAATTSTKTVSNSHDASTVRCNVGNVHYEKVFLSSSTPIAPSINVSTATQSATNSTTTTVTSKSGTNSFVPPVSPKLKNWISAQSNMSSNSDAIEITTASTSSSNVVNQKTNRSAQTTSTTSVVNESLPSSSSICIGGSPALQRRATALRPGLTRGLTEAVITSRPSRRDFYFSNINRKSQNSAQTSKQSTTKANTPTVNNNENGESLQTNESSAALHTAENRLVSDILDQRRRSSSTSDARTPRTARGTNNNETSAVYRGTGAFRIQQPPQPFHSVENNLLAATGAVGIGSSMSPPPSGNSPSKRLTLREQQVMQLRREIMHPGGVRLQLRRKDCINSIAWVEAFGAVWVAGWKQKEHPVLYNALHIGDQLLSIAGVTIISGNEANKFIRNANTLFVEVLIRRMPFGRGYAIRRDREGQCLGLIRDGNTATIVDVVPNSLAARHGLPPKAQSCDGTALTFWVLSEINGRPLNLFFKDNEIRDRLNSVGRDISILVQPSDLITKLKKQLKSLRGYKDYLVQ